MVYSDSRKQTFIIVAIIIIALGILGYQQYGERIDDWISSRNFLTQVVPISQDDQTFLIDLQGLAFLEPEEVATPEAFQARIILTLFDHIDSEGLDPSNAAELEDFIKAYYTMPDPLPTDRSAIQDNITIAVDKFVQSYPAVPIVGPVTPTSTPAPTPTPTPVLNAFFDQLITILANHQASTNNFQAVRRAQTTRALLEAFANQL